MKKNLVCLLVFGLLLIGTLILFRLLTQSIYFEYEVSRESSRHESLIVSSSSNHSWITLSEYFPHCEANLISGWSFLLEPQNGSRGEYQYFVREIRIGPEAESPFSVIEHRERFGEAGDGQYRVDFPVPAAVLTVPELVVQAKIVIRRKDATESEFDVKFVHEIQKTRRKTSRIISE